VGLPEREVRSLEIRDIHVDESVGLTLAYDLTGITPGKQKGAVLRRGHVIREEDLELLRDIGKSRIRILDLAPDEVHEDEAAERLARILAGQGIQVALPGEAWADLVASAAGLLKVDSERLLRLNLLDDLLVATRHNNSTVRAGEIIAKAKVRELAVRETVLEQATSLAEGSTRTLEVLPFRVVRGAAVITGREIYEGRKKDAFEPLLRTRLEEYGSALVNVEIVPDEVSDIRRALASALDMGFEIVFVTGGGSPDDSTSESVARVADELVFHGAPVSPGAMSMLAYSRDVPILSVPGGLLARPHGFIDLVLPRLLAGDRISKEDVAEYGHGGLCLRCAACVFPDCPFGK